MAVLSDRGQGFTLEAILAAMVLLTTITFAFYIAGITPNTPSTADASVEQQHRSIADGVLDAGVADDSLHATLLYWNDTAGTFHETNDGYYISQPPPTAFGERLDRGLRAYGLQYNLDALVVTDDGIERHRIVHSGTPTDHAVRSVTTVTLLAEDELIFANETSSNTTIATADTFYATKALDEDGHVVVRIELVVWQT